MQRHAARPASLPTVVAMAHGRAAPSSVRSGLLCGMVAVAFAILLAGAPARAAALAEHFGVSDPMSDKTVDHSVWGRLLAAYVTPGPDGVNRLDYGRLAETPADLARLGGYIDRLQDVEVSALARDEQFAFWVNLYNALTVEVIVEHYPVSSIRDISISPGLFSIGPWGKKLATVEGRELSLDDIEHAILRKAWTEPRVHYAVNCASIGCPDLATDPYTGADLDAQLDRAARAYVNHPRGVSFAGGRLTLSSIYDWYGKDFGATQAERLAAIAAHAEPETARRLRAYGGRVRYAYDWTLNDTAAD